MARQEFFGEVIRYSQTGQGKKLKSFLGTRGDLGKRIADMLDDSGSRNMAKDVDHFLRVLREQGHDVSSVLEAPVSAPHQAQVGNVPTVRRPGPADNPGEHDISSPARRLPSGIDEDEMVWIKTPESSNVYSFAYDRDNGILYVQFRADGPAIGKRRGINSCTGENYSYGVRANSPGTIYSYGSRAQPVPPALYSEMRSTTSKGRFVQTRLKVCDGAGHRYPVNVAVVMTPEGEKTPYVPRKLVGQESITIHDEEGKAHATEILDRFRVRTVPVVGTGRRASNPSTIQRKT